MGLEVALQGEDPDHGRVHGYQPRGASNCSASTGLGQPMVSLESAKLEAEQLLAPRGW